MSTQNENKISKENNWRWLAFVSLSAIIIMILGIENVMEKKLSFVLLVLLTFFPIVVTRRLSAVGITKKNLKSSILVGSAVGLAYGIVRGFVLKFVPYGSFILGADLVRIASRLETGIQFGILPITANGFWMFLLISILFAPFVLGIELYFRGFMFLTLKKYIPWPLAIAITSTVQAISRRTPHSLVMGSIGGVLMQKYDNILAPSFMHGFQFFTALAIFLYL